MGRTNLKCRLGLSLRAVGVVIALGAWSNADGQTAPPQVGEKAPDFSLTSLDGKTVRLSELTAKQPVVLAVLRGYPGYQCPICTQQVGEFSSRAKRFAETGAHVVLVYPGPADGLKKYAAEFVGKRILPENFTMVLDPDYQFTSSYHLRWDAPRQTAYPSTFVIDRQGQVRFAKVSKTHGGRAAAEDVLKTLSQIDRAK